MPSTNRDNKWWIKWWVKDTLYGTLGSAPLSELGFFVKLCALSNEMRFPGRIMQNEGVGFPHMAIAGMLQLDIDEFEEHLEKMKKEERITEDDAGVIYITKFEWYQKQKGVPTYKQERNVGRPSQATIDARQLASTLAFLDKYPAMREIVADPAKRKEAVDMLIEMKKEEVENV